MRSEATRTLPARPPWEESVPSFERTVGRVAPRYGRSSSAGCVPTRCHRFGR